MSEIDGQRDRRAREQRASEQTIDHREQSAYRPHPRTAHRTRTRAPAADTSTCDSHLRPAKRRKEEAFHTHRGKGRNPKNKKLKSKRARVTDSHLPGFWPATVSCVSFSYSFRPGLRANAPPFFRHRITSHHTTRTQNKIEYTENRERTRYFIALIYSFWLAAATCSLQDGDRTTYLYTDSDRACCVVLCCVV